MKSTISATFVVLTLLCGSAALPAAPGEDTIATDEAASRDYFSDTLLINQDGEEVRFYSDVLKDQIVVINFIFTNCEGACPMVTHKLRMARAQLDDELAARIRFVSISIDPQRDTPDALKKFADEHKADGNWVLLTGPQENIDLVVRKLGQYYPDVEEHSTLVIAGNVKTRFWMKIPPNVPPAGIADKLQELPAG